MSLTIERVDYNNPAQGEQLIELLSGYANDIQGGGSPLKEEVVAHLVERLSDTPSAVSFIAYVDGNPAGLANCFEGFSTFSAAPLLNIHDLAVSLDYRRKGVGLALLEFIESYSKEMGYCKITLEVLRNNTIAQNLYKKFGFGG